MDEDAPSLDLPTAEWVAACRQAAERLRNLSHETFEVERMALVVEACGFDVTARSKETTTHLRLSTRFVTNEFTTNDIGGDAGIK